MKIHNTNSYDLVVVIAKHQYHIKPNETKDVIDYSPLSLPEGVVVVNEKVTSKPEENEVPVNRSPEVVVTSTKVKNDSKKHK